MHLPPPAILVAVSLASATASIAADRAALVVGNESYMTGQSAPGAVAASERAAALLEDAGFTVVYGRDLGASEMAAKLAEFEDQARDAEVALVVYVGRAVAFGGDTWLVSVAAGTDTLTELAAGAAPLALPLAIAGRAKASVVVFDGTWPARLDGDPGLGVGVFDELPGVVPGLATIAEPRGLIISAASPGAKPERHDGAEDFVVEAVTALLGPGADLTGGEDRLREALPDAYVAGALTSEADLALQTDAERADELDLWARAEAGGKTGDFVAYLQRYPSGIFAHVARNSLEELEGGDPGMVAVQEDALNLDDAQRSQIVRNLADQGFDVGDATEVFDPATRDAIRDWQRANGHPATGFLTREMARELLSP